MATSPFGSVVVLALLQYVSPIVTLFDNNSLLMPSLNSAFNAAFVILGLFWVCRNEVVTGQSMAALVDRAQSYPGRAIAALLKLDGGNRMVDRCRVYLEQFSSALDARGEYTFIHSFSSSLLAVFRCLFLSWGSIYSYDNLHRKSNLRLESRPQLSL